MYTTCLKKYFQFPEPRGTHLSPKEIEDHVISFIIFLKKQGKGFGAIHNYVAAICKYYKINDVYLNTNKIKQYLPEYRKSKKDRAYSAEEIQKLLDIVDDRFRAVILLLASTGMRVGAISSLKISNLDEISSEINSQEFYKITVYEGFNEEYITFCTPECKISIDSYLAMRERYGEKLAANSFLIREQFDIRDPFAIVSKCNGIKSNTLSRKLIDIAERAGIRSRDLLEEGKHRATIRKDVPIAHGFRKFFSSQLVQSDLKTELRWLLEGHNLKGNDSNYVRVSEKRLQEEYEKAIDNLTIDPANRQKREIQILKIEKNRIDSLELKIKKLEKRHGRIR